MTETISIKNLGGLTTDARHMLYILTFSGTACDRGRCTHRLRFWSWKRQEMATAEVFLKQLAHLYLNFDYNIGII